MSCVAVLDVDGTLIPGSLGLRLIDRLRVEGLGAPSAMARLTATMRGYRGGRITYQEMVEAGTDAYSAAICGLAESVVEELAASVWAEVRGELFPFARPMIERLRERGLRPVIISSSPAIIVRQLGNALAVPDAAGSSFTITDGVYSGGCRRMPGRPGGKLRALEEMSDDALDLGGSFALGNAFSDVCVLAAVGKPLAFEPSAELDAIARHRGWAIADRQNMLGILDSVLNVGSRALDS